MGEYGKMAAFNHITDQEKAAGWKNWLESSGFWC